jgi:hypothetical protein
VAASSEEYLDPELQRIFDGFRRKEQRWRPRARYVHDLSLPPATWQVDGVTQAEALTEDALDAQLRREGKGKKVVAVSAPLHVTLSGIIGFSPPYSKSSAAGD